MLILKLSDDQVSKLGVKTADELLAKFDTDTVAESNLDSIKSILLSTNERVSHFESAQTEISNRVDALEKRFGSGQRLTEDEIRMLAETAASRMCVQALGAVGTNPVTPAPVSPTIQAAQSAAKKDDHAAHWDADKNIQAEFPERDIYIAFQKATARGMVQISGQRN